MKGIELNAVVKNIACGQRPTICVKQYGRKLRAATGHCSGPHKMITKAQQPLVATFNELVDELDAGQNEYTVEFARKKEDFSQQ